LKAGDTVSIASGFNLAIGFRRGPAGVPHAATGLHPLDTPQFEFAGLAGTVLVPPDTAKGDGDGGYT
jgi:hypothetical protein